MTYHIRRSHDKEERSLHADTIPGYEAANVEAGFRATHTGYAHEVYCDVTDTVMQVHEPWLHARETLEEAADRLSDGIPPSNASSTTSSSDSFLMGIIGALLVAIIVRLFWS